MILETVINHFLTYGVDNVVVEKGLNLFNRLQSSSKEIQIDVIEDVRSATFFALGLSQKSNKPVVLVVNGDYLSNSYTGLTEAWYQRRPIIVICLYDRVLNEDVSYLKVCTQDIFKVQTEDDFKNSIDNLHTLTTPVIFMIEEKRNSFTTHNFLDLNQILKFLNSDDKLFVYETLSSVEQEDSRLNIISKKDKYGIISKFMGFCIGFKEKAILVTVAESIKLDMNLFNNRYMNKNFKVIVIGLIDDLEIDNWLYSNQITIMHSKILSDDIVRNFIDLQAACILFVNQMKEGN